MNDKLCIQIIHIQSHLIKHFLINFLFQASLSGEPSCQHHESEFDEGEGSEDEDEMYEEESDEDEEDETKTRLAWDKNVWGAGHLWSDEDTLYQEATYSYTLNSQHHTSSHIIKIF